MFIRHGFAYFADAVSFYISKKMDIVSIKILILTQVDKHMWSKS